MHSQSFESRWHSIYLKTLTNTSLLICPAAVQLAFPHKQMCHLSQSTHCSLYKIYITKSTLQLVYLFSQLGNRKLGTLYMYLYIYIYFIQSSV